MSEKRKRIVPSKLRDMADPTEAEDNDPPSVLFAWIEREGKCCVMSESSLLKTAVDSSTQEKANVTFKGQHLNVKQSNKNWKIEIIDKGSKSEMKNVEAAWIREQETGEVTDPEESTSDKQPCVDLMKEIEEEEKAHKKTRKAENVKLPEDDSDSDKTSDTTSYSSTNSKKQPSFLKNLKIDMNLVASDSSALRKEVEAVQMAVSIANNKLDIVLGRLPRLPQKINEIKKTTLSADKGDSVQISSPQAANGSFIDLPESPGTSNSATDSQTKIKFFAELKRANKAGAPIKYALALADDLYEGDDLSSGKCLPGTQKTSRPSFSPTRINFIKDKCNEKFGITKTTKHWTDVRKRLNAKFYDRKAKKVPNKSEETINRSNMKRVLKKNKMKNKKKSNKKRRRDKSSSSSSSSQSNSSDSSETDTSSSN